MRHFFKFANNINVTLLFQTMLVASCIFRRRKVNLFEIKDIATLSENEETLYYYD